MVVRHLLLDADGVLQRVGGAGWRDEISRRLGDRTDDFVRAVSAHEAPALRGRGPFPEGLDVVLSDHRGEYGPGAVPHRPPPSPRERGEGVHREARPASRHRSSASGCSRR